MTTGMINIHWNIYEKDMVNSINALERTCNFSDAIDRVLWEQRYKNMLYAQFMQNNSMRQNYETWINDGKNNIQYKYYALQGKNQADIACALSFSLHKHN